MKKYLLFALISCLIISCDCYNTSKVLIINDTNINFTAKAFKKDYLVPRFIPGVEPDINDVCIINKKTIVLFDDYTSLELISFDRYDRIELQDMSNLKLPPIIITKNESILYKHNDYNVLFLITIK